MIYSVTVVALFAAHAAAHGLITSVQGANGAKMPGLTVVDGTYRTIQQNLFGQTDTSLIDDDNKGPLGVNGAGAVDPAANVAIYMGKKKAPKPPPPLLPLPGVKESIVGDTAGNGAKKGLPTPDKNGILTMTWHQVNVDGAGPLNAQLDTSSGGTNLDAFNDVAVTTNVPGTNGESENILQSFPVKVQIPRGTKCTGTVAGVRNVCVVRVRTPAGNWGGAAAFTTGGAANRRTRSRRMSRRRVDHSAPVGEAVEA